MHSTPTNLQKKSFSISTESVDFLDELRRERNSKSASQVLDEILIEARRAHKLKMLEQATTQYYDQLGQEERKERQLWGDLAISNFPDDRG